MSDEEKKPDENEAKNEPKETEEIIYTNEENAYEIFKKGEKFFRRCLICEQTGGAYPDKNKANLSAASHSRKHKGEIAKKKKQKEQEENQKDPFADEEPLDILRSVLERKIYGLTKDLIDYITEEAQFSEEGILQPAQLESLLNDMGVKNPRKTNRIVEDYERRLTYMRESAMRREGRRRMITTSGGQAGRRQMHGIPPRDFGGGYTTYYPPEEEMMGEGRPLTAEGVRQIIREEETRKEGFRGRFGKDERNEKIEELEKQIKDLNETREKDKEESWREKLMEKLDGLNTRISMLETQDSSGGGNYKIVVDGQEIRTDEQGYMAWKQFKDERERVRREEKKAEAEKRDQRQTEKTTELEGMRNQLQELRDQMNERERQRYESEVERLDNELKNERERAQVEGFRDDKMKLIGQGINRLADTLEKSKPLKTFMGSGEVPQREYEKGSRERPEELPEEFVY